MALREPGKRMSALVGSRGRKKCHLMAASRAERYMRRYWEVLPLRRRCCYLKSIYVGLSKQPSGAVWAVVRFTLRNFELDIG